MTLSTTPPAFETSSLRCRHCFKLMAEDIGGDVYGDVVSIAFCLNCGPIQPETADWAVGLRHAIATVIANRPHRSTQ